VHCTKISAEFEFEGHSPLVMRTPPPKNVAFGYDVAKISADRLVRLCAQ